MNLNLEQLIKKEKSEIYKSFQTSYLDGYPYLQPVSEDFFFSEKYEPKKLTRLGLFFTRLYNTISH